MAFRRCLQALSHRDTTRISTKFISSAAPLFETTLTLTPPPPFPHLESVAGTWYIPLSHLRHFSSRLLHSGGESENDEDVGEEDISEEDSGGEDSDGEDSDTVAELGREYSTEEKEAEAAAIGYKVVGPLQRSDRVFKPYEPVFAVVQIGSHQFKVSNRDSIYVERLKFCEVNDKLILSKVLLLGSSTKTIVGRPTVPEAAVHAVVEEHALDAKVIIFKKKRRKNYRRTKGHRQELTKLRITDIEGIEKPEMKVDPKSPEKAGVKKAEKVAVAVSA